ncbi:unnamed protein product [Ixodes persulcatus]
MYFFREIPTACVFSPKLGVPRALISGGSVTGATGVSCGKTFGLFLLKPDVAVEIQSIRSLAAIKRLFVMIAGLAVILPRQSSPRWTVSPCRGSAGENKDDRETNTFCRSHKAGYGFIEQPGVERDAGG